MSNGLELHTVDELVSELARRSTFYGAIVYMKSDFKAASPADQQMALRMSTAITNRGAIDLLRSALEAVVEIEIGEGGGG